MFWDAKYGWTTYLNPCNSSHEWAGSSAVEHVTFNPAQEQEKTSQINGWFCCVGAIVGINRIGARNSFALLQRYYIRCAWRETRKPPQGVFDFLIVNVGVTLRDLHRGMTKGTGNDLERSAGLAKPSRMAMSEIVPVEVADSRSLKASREMLPVIGAIENIRALARATGQNGPSFGR
jgi:hypothetical protein